MNKRIQKKMHKNIFANHALYVLFEDLNRPESKYVNLFIARRKSKNNMYKQLQEQARRKVGQEKKERQNVSNERTKAIVDKLVDVEVKIREVFANV